MKVLGILGSPRKGGNTDLLLGEFLKGAASVGAATEKIYLGGLEFKGCIECGGCDKTGKCVLSDDMSPLYAKLSAADMVILASPVFFASVTSQLKAMIDRCQSEWVAKYKLKVKSKKAKGAKGVFICAGGHKDDVFFKTAKKTIDVFFKTMDIDFAAELFFGGCDKAGDIKNVKGALAAAYDLGRRMAS